MFPKKYDWYTNFKHILLYKKCALHKEFIIQLNNERDFINFIQYLILQKIMKKIFIKDSFYISKF